MIPLAVAVLTASLVGSVHCAGMCGGFAAFAAGDVPRRTGVRGLGVHLASGAGRLVAYAALGAVAGTLGATLDLAGALGGVQRAAAVAAGILIIVWGAASLLQALRVRVPHPGPSRTLARLLALGLRGVARRPPAQRAFAIGLLSACLPCGWLYAFVVTAAGTGSAASGALLMAVFWLGTMPMMLSLGAGLQALAGPLRRHVPAACAVAMIVVGLLAVGGRVGHHGSAGAHPGSAAGSLGHAEAPAARAAAAVEAPGSGETAPHAHE